MPPSHPLIGNEERMAAMFAAFDGGRLPHALLIAGPQRVGKTTAATLLAAHVLGGDAAASPNFTLVERGRDAKTGKLKNAVTIEQVRDARARLQQSAFGGGWKVAVIDGVDELAAPAANAMLKTLEEPPERTLLILTAASERDVLATIRSRADVVRFVRVPQRVLIDGLLHRGVDAAIAGRAAAIADGRPGLAIALAEDADALEEAERFRTEFVEAASNVVAAFAFIDRRLPQKLPFQESLERARDTLDAASVVLHDAFVASWEARPTDGAAAALARRLGPRCGEALDLGAKLKEYLDANAAPRPVLERFMLFLQDAKP
jgi:DNA polymerase-3 subunit delta'